jgi:hypothetical protein
MNTQRPTSIKNTGLVITILSGLVVFSNGMSALMFTLLGFTDYETHETADLTGIDYFFNNISYFLLVLIVIGMLFFIGGIQLMKYKLWAKKFLTGLSIFVLALLSFLLIIGIYSSITNSEMVFAAILIAFVWVGFSVPLLLLIRFLNKEEVANHLS